ncbi:MAG: translation factor Sua5, partial [Alphaproteobacteria bacterium]
PSANLSGHISPTRAEHVLADLEGRVDLILDAGECPLGLESTVVRVMDDGRVRILRPGAVTREDLARVLECKARIEDEAMLTTQTSQIESPGMLARHYAPEKPLRLDVRRPAADEFMIGFGEIAGDANLSTAGDLGEAAARLFSLLRMAEASDKPRIAVAPIPSEGLGRAIRDRLARAAQAPLAQEKEE